MGLVCIMSQYLINPAARSGHTPPGLFSTDVYEDVSAFFQSPPTPLWHLRQLAAEVNIRDILLKDESARLGLNAFKILGVSYAVSRLLTEGRILNDSVLVCASQGNHGRAVARAAREHGLEAKIYISRDVTSAQVEAIQREGAQVVTVEGNYDRAVRLVADHAGSNGWTIISDTSWAGYTDIPRRIMAGYTRLLAEAEAQWRQEGLQEGSQEDSAKPPPDVVLVQAGVGGLACAVLSWLCWRFGAHRPFTIICEPTMAACHLESARAGHPVSLHGSLSTIMAGLRCGELSPLAWPTIIAAADAFCSIDDEETLAAMQILAHPVKNDPVVVAGSSGACGLAALLAILRNKGFEGLRSASGLTAQSRVLVINTEGATDPELHSQITRKDISYSNSPANRMP